MTQLSLSEQKSPVQYTPSVEELVNGSTWTEAYADRNTQQYEGTTNDAKYSLLAKLETNTQGSFLSICAMPTNEKTNAISYTFAWKKPSSDPIGDIATIFSLQLHTPRSKGPEYLIAIQRNAHAKSDNKC